MLFRDGLWRDTFDDPGDVNGSAPSNDGGTGPTRRQLDDLRRGCAAVEQTLESIAAPAFIVDAAGAVLQANVAGRLALARDAVAIAASLATAVAAGRPTRDWSLAPLSSRGGAVPLLAILLTHPRRPETTEPFLAARLRWRLTARQAQVLELVARGLTNALVAETLDISEGTVEYHLTALFDKVGVCNRATLIVRLLELAQRP